MLAFRLPLLRRAFERFRSRGGRRRPEFRAFRRRQRVLARRLRLVRGAEAGERRQVLVAVGRGAAHARAAGAGAGEARTGRGDPVPAVRAVRVRPAVAGAAGALREARHRPDRRHPDLRRLRQRGGVGQPPPVPPRPRRPAEGRLRLPAGLLQRRRAALGPPALRLAGPREGGLPLVGRAVPPDASAGSTACASTTSSASTASGRSPRTARPPSAAATCRAPGDGVLRGDAAQARRRADHRGGPRLRRRPRRWRCATVSTFPACACCSSASATAADTTCRTTTRVARSPTPARTTTTPPPAGSARSRRRSGGGPSPTPAATVTAAAATEPTTPRSRGRSSAPRWPASPTRRSSPCRTCSASDSGGRMNVPGTVKHNWSWRLPPKALTPAIARRLRGMCELYERV